MQSERSSRPRPNQNDRRAYAPRKSVHNVLPQIVGHAGFSLDLAEAFQCIVGESYSVAEVCAERTYFTEHARKIIVAIFDDPHPDTPKPRLLKEMAEATRSLISPEALENSIVLYTVKCGQLKKFSGTPDLSTRENPEARDDMYVPPTEFESWTAEKKRFAQAPESLGGTYYELVTDKSLKFNIELVYQIKLPSFDEDEDGNRDPEMVR
jgi:hypothetical protein